MFRKYEGTSRYDERSDEVSLIGNKMKLGISGKLSEGSFLQRDRLSITRESKSIKIDWIELFSEEELGEWDENTQRLEGFSW